MMFQLESILICLYVGYVLGNVESPPFARIPDLINHLCPGSDVCSGNSSSKAAGDKISFPAGGESCCAECSCASDCSSNGNCCFTDTVSSESSSDGYFEDFRNSRTCLFPMFPQPELNKQIKYQSFLMVSSVQNISSVSLKGPSNLSCSEINVAPWGSLYPVYSAKSKQIYKNIECAKEDGEDADVILWDAVINCQDKQQIQGVDLAATGIDTNSFPESCRVDFIFPGSYDVLKPLRCYINLIDTCSESQDFQVPEGTNVSKDEIRSLCTKSGFLSPYRARRAYANVFCYICSAKAFQRDSFCFKYEGHSDTKVEHEGGFIALIDDKFITERRHYLDLPTACSVKNVHSCRQIFCPTGKLRNQRNKCVYPNKLWYNQNYAVYINLTLGTFINVTEAFGIPYVGFYSKVLPPLQSVWMKKWFMDSVYYRVMDEPHLTNNLIIVMQRKLPLVKPDTLITNIKKMIGKEWTMRLQNVTEVLRSAEFSMSSPLSFYSYRNKADSFYNLSKALEWSQYIKAYSAYVIYQKEHIISMLYFCNQVELEPSEFLLNSAKNAMYIYTSKRVLFDKQFAVVRSNTLSDSRARICIEDSGLYERGKNAGNNITTIYLCFVVASLLLIWPF